MKITRQRSLANIIASWSPLDVPETHLVAAMIADAIHASRSRCDVRRHEAQRFCAGAMREWAGLIGVDYHYLLTQIEVYLTHGEDGNNERTTEGAAEDAGQYAHDGAGESAGADMAT